MADSEKTLDIILKYGLDSSALQQTTAGVNSTTTALANQEQQLRRNRTELRELGQVFTAIGLAGAAIYVPAIAASQAYLKSAGQNEALSRAWLADTDKIKQSTIDVGRVVTEGLLPGYTQVANIVAQFSAFADKNPQLVQAAVGLAGGLVAIAAAGKVFTEVDRAVVDIQLIAATMMKKAADEQLTAAGGMNASGGSILGSGAGGGLVSMIAPLVIPLIAMVGGAAIYNAIKPAGAPTAAQVIPEANADMYVLFAKPILDKLGPFGQAVEKFDESVLKFQLGVTGATNGAVTTGGGIGTLGGMTQADYNTGLVDYTAHEQKLTDIQKQYDTEMEQNDQAARDQIAQIEDNFNKNAITQARDRGEQVATQNRDYMEQETQALQGFNQSQADAARNFQESQLQALETYQDQQAAAAQSHQDNLRSLTQKHDVLGIEQETLKYNETKAKDQKTFTEANNQRIFQYNQTMADNKRNFEQQREQAAFNFQQQQSDQKKAWAQTDADAKQNEIDQENAVIANHNKQMVQLGKNLDDKNELEQTAFTNQMDGLQKITTAAEIAMEKNYIAFLASLGVNTTGAGTHDAGGYFMPGSARNATGRAEFVAAPDTVKYAESIVGGRLTQQNLIASMISGRSGGASSSIYQDSRSVNVSGLTAQDRLVVRDLVNRGVSDWAKAEFGNR